MEKSREQVEALAALADIDWFEDNRVSKSFYIICEELASKYYGTKEISQEELLKFMINLLWQAGHDADDDRFMDWYGGIYHKFADLLESRADELPEDDDYFEIYQDCE